MTPALRRRDSRDRGETLLELVMAIAIIGSSGVLLLGALTAAWINADRQDGTERARNLAARAAEFSTADSLRFEPCAQPGTYQPALDALVAAEQGAPPEEPGFVASEAGQIAPEHEETPASPAPGRFSLTVVEVAGWNGSSFTSEGTCDPETQRLQRITVKAQGPAGAVQQVVFTKSRTKTDGSEALVNSTTTPTTLGTWALSVASPAAAPAPEGTVRFAVFAPNDTDCSNPLWTTLKDPADPQANPAAKAGRAPSQPLQETPDIDFADRSAKSDAPMFDIAGAYGNEPGTYRWRATYLGGAEADPSSTPCGGEPSREIPLEKVQIALPPQTLNPGGVAAYQPNLQLGNVVPGSVQFTVHGIAQGAPGDPCTTGQTYALAPMQPAPGGAVQFQVDPSMYDDYGDYVVTAEYSGDVGHLPLRQECQQGQMLRVKAPSTLGLMLTPVPDGVDLSAALIDGWTGPVGESGAPGTVTFQVFNGGDCGSPASGGEEPVPLENGQAATSVGGLQPGDYSAKAQWSGDARNVGDETSCQQFTVAGDPESSGAGDPMAPGTFGPNGPVGPQPGAPVDPAPVPQGRFVPTRPV